ncbi:MAG: right-handed parallel beta-helix repeat-containing protein [Pseudomonadota bacterium]
MRYLPLVLLAACASPHRKHKAPEELACAAGYLADGDVCVPEACGVGTWGALEVDGGTVYVSAAADEGGDGSAEAPLRSIQAGLELAGERGGGLVAVAAGSYPENLVMTSDHAGVHLAGRCRELVVLDASVGGDGTAGIDLDTRFAEVEVSGVSVVGSGWVGVLVGSGVARLVDLSVEKSAYYGIVAYQSDALVPTSLAIEGAEVAENETAGITIQDAKTQVIVQDTLVRDSLPDGHGGTGHGIGVSSGATLVAEGVEISGNTMVGIAAQDPGTQLTLRGSLVRDTVPAGSGQVGYGLEVHNGATLEAWGVEVSGNTMAGIVAQDAGTRLTLQDTLVRDTMPTENGQFGYGIEVIYGATLVAGGGEVTGNMTVGILAKDAGTQVTLRDTLVLGTLPNEDGEGGTGIEVVGTATLVAEGVQIVGNATRGVVASEAGTQVALRDTLVRDTQPDENGEEGYGIEVLEGAVLVAEGVEVAGNTWFGIVAEDAGTRVALRDTLVRDTLPDQDGEGGYGIGAGNGAMLVAEGVEVARNTWTGIAAKDTGTRVTLQDTLVRDTLPYGDGTGGFGIVAYQGAMLVAEGVEVAESMSAGIVATDAGTQVAIRDSSITGTTAVFGEQGAVALGLVAQYGGTVIASGLIARGNDGPALYTVDEGHLSCTGCSLIDSAFAGAMANDAGALEIHASTISGTRVATDLGGGVGVWAAQQWDWAPPTLLVTDSTITDNPIAGVWLSGQGSFDLSGNRISGGEGEPFGSRTRCGDAVFAGDGVSAWTGTSGLRLDGNLLQGASGAGLFLDASGALLGENTFSGNALDLLVQGEPCSGEPAGWDGSGTSRVCPSASGGYDEPTCHDAFSLIPNADPIEPALPPPPAWLPMANRSPHLPALPALDLPRFEILPPPVAP